jgi:hypothetical protein
MYNGSGGDEMLSVGARVDAGCNGAVGIVSSGRGEVGMVSMGRADRAERLSIGCVGWVSTGSSRLM